MAAQFAPDADFPTVSFPNPEEPGAMDLALAAARRPTAIWSSPTIPTQTGAPSACRRPTAGACSRATRWATCSAGGSPPATAGSARRGVFAQSIVSGSMLARIAADAHLDYEQTLTGFKWIARVPDLAFGYEEALGYCVDPNGVRDKDGITAGLMMAEMAARLKSWTAASCRCSTISP